jgi:uncharacterized protein (DUF1778 family)
MEPRTRRLEIRLTEDEHQALKRVADKDHRTLSDAARLAIKAYIANGDDQ